MVKAVVIIVLVSSTLAFGLKGLAKATQSVEGTQTLQQQRIDTILAER